MEDGSVIAEGSMRSIDLVYAAAIVAFFAWMALGGGDALTDLDSDALRTSAPRALPPVSAPGTATRTELTAPTPPAPPRFAASATIDGRKFEILVGEGAPPWSVAVGVDD
jgi:hypothetical protein